MMGILRSGRFLVRQFIKRNTEYLKRTSSGNDLVFYCDSTEFQWHARTAGYSGSEESIINIGRELAKLGWNVTVYNSCGDKPLVDEGVTYRPFWEFDPRDRQDVVILWRWASPVDWDINARALFIDMHDLMPEWMFTKRNRIAKITRVFVKSKFQRSLYPNLPDRKLAVVPNGIDLKLLDTHEQKDPFLLINTSSADRSMSVLPKLFKEVKRRVPMARLQWAFGWALFEKFNAHDSERLKWMEHTKREMAASDIETLGNLTQADVGKLYQSGAIYAYPSDFLENDSISIKKAQACGCVPVATNAGGLAEGIQFGIKIPCKEADVQTQLRRSYFGIEDTECQRLWIDATVELLTNSEKRMALAEQGTRWARQFSWSAIAARWDQILRDTVAAKGRLEAAQRDFMVYFQ
jgi:glycosyltransferase involved in cell wall biosynthesis